MEYADILSREYTQEHKVHMQIKLPLSLLFNFASVSFGGHSVSSQRFMVLDLVQKCT